MLASEALKQYGFFVRGVSGRHVMLDRTWYRDCVPDGAGGWARSIRTMSGRELATTIVTYAAPPGLDTLEGAVMLTVFVQQLTNDDRRIPITWVDLAGQPAAPPAGLEHVTEGQGATGVVTFATGTPLIGDRASMLNAIAFGGYRDWAAGTTKSLLPYFTALGPGKGTIIVDDRTETGCVYDGVSLDPREYPTRVPNAVPHTGPLNGISY